VNTYTTGDQAYPSVCVAPSGGFVVAWESRGADNGIFVRRYAGNGAAMGEEVAADSGTVQPPPPCPGDCSRDDVVTIDELLIGIGIALGEIAMVECTEVDNDADEAVGIEELVDAVGATLNGCGKSPTQAPHTPTPVEGERTLRPTVPPQPTRTPVIAEERTRKPAPS
jgi:hypothetical protein